MQWIKLLILLSVVTLWISHSEAQTSGGGPFTHSPTLSVTDTLTTSSVYQLQFTTGSIYCIGGKCIITGGGSIGSSISGSTANEVYYSDSSNRFAQSPNLQFNGYSLILGAGNSSSTGTHNIGIGKNTLSSITSDSFDVAVGDSSLKMITGGFNANTAFGYNVLSSLTSAGGNTAFGGSIGIGIASMTYGTLLGYMTTPMSTGDTNETVIGNNLTGNGSNTVTIGNSSVTDNYFSGNLKPTGRYLYDATGHVVIDWRRVGGFQGSETLSFDNSDTAYFAGAINTVGINMQNGNTMCDISNNCGYSTFVPTGTVAYQGDNISEFNNNSGYFNSQSGSSGVLVSYGASSNFNTDLAYWDGVGNLDDSGISYAQVCQSNGTNCPSYVLAPTISAISTNTNLANNTIYLITTATTALTLTLPTPTSGTKIWLKDVSFNASVKNVTVAQHGSEKIEGTAASLILQTNGFNVYLLADGTNWYILGE